MMDNLSQKQKEGMDSAEAKEYEARQKKRALANMKFIGNLFLRKLLATKVISSVLVNLIGDTENIPEEYHVEFACVLSQTVGKSLEDSGERPTHIHN